MGSHQDNAQEVEEKPNPNPSCISSEPPQLQLPQSQQPPCWKCKGYGRKYSKSTKQYDGSLCKVCNGQGYRLPSTKSQSLENQAGRILELRGYPNDHPLKQYFPDGFAGPRAVWGTVSQRRNNKQTKGGDDDDTTYWEDLPTNLKPCDGELVASLGCGDWRIYQVANGNKLTVDDFICAYVAAQEMRKRGYGVQQQQRQQDDDDDDADNVVKTTYGEIMFGGMQPKSTNLQVEKDYFTHADLGTGCGSVLMMIAWAFWGHVRSVGVEAQEISFRCLNRGLEWNVGSDGTNPNDIVKVKQHDLRSWDGTVPGGNDGKMSLKPPYKLITGTPPYFPIDSFVASQNHDQKVRCRVPTRGSASDYIDTASRLLADDDKNGGVFCMVEAAFEKAEATVIETAQKCGMTIERRLDVITRAGLPPRFSCWVMTKGKTVSGRNPNKDATNTFSIGTLTIRNTDLTRTEEYSAALEVMGWVDFEKSKCKSEKKMVELEGLGLDNSL
jgi:tRNA1(Val) A37 N6-methylase TrmN6